jgi:DNA-binding MarR family transcriptional regulator
MHRRNDDRGDLAAALLIEKIVRGTYTKNSTEVQPLQWSILRYLERAPEPRCTMTWIRSFLGLTHAPVVRAIKTLVNRGLVEQLDNPSDARSNILRLTHKGCETLAFDPMLSVALRIQKLPEVEREQFKKIVRAITMDLEMAESNFHEKAPPD